jgi:hypothetical protein
LETPDCGRKDPLLGVQSRLSKTFSQDDALLQIMPESGGTIMGLRATGKLTDQDYQKVLIPNLEALIKKHEPPGSSS